LAGLGAGVGPRRLRLSSPSMPAESFRIAGMHAGTLTFTAAIPGSYQYLCPVPGHARGGMAGTFTVR
jgi:plastocyanin